MNFSDHTAASTAPRIYGDIYSMLNQKHLKARRYKAFKNLILTNIDIPISGLEWTTIDNIHSSQMVPQGLCCANQYLLMTSYAHKPASAKTALAVLNIKDGSYVKTIGIEPVHAGGIAFHPQSGYVWISCDEPGKSTARLMCVALNTVLKQKEGTALSESSFSLFYLAELPRSSYLTIHDNLLCVGYFSKTKAGRFYTIPLNALGQPEVTEGNTLKPLYGCNTRDYIQGVSFIKTASQKYAVFSQSYGIRSHSMFFERGSKLLIYPYEELKKADFFGKPKKRIGMPVMIEQTYPYRNEILFAVFESASRVYYDNPAPKGGNSKNQIDHICGLDLKKIVL